MLTFYCYCSCYHHSPTLAMAAPHPPPLSAPLEASSSTLPTTFTSPISNSMSSAPSAAARASSQARALLAMIVMVFKGIIEDIKYVTFAELPRFTPTHKSAMSRYLTQELFDKLKDVKSSKNYTLSNVIMTDVVTPHLGVGATAGDEECWDLFRERFYPIIKEWHGYDAYTQTHPVDLDPSKVIFSEEQKATFRGLRCVDEHSSSEESLGILLALRGHRRRSRWG